MTLKIKKDGDQTVVTFTYKGTTAKVMALLEGAAHAAYNEGRTFSEHGGTIKWENISNADRLKVLDNYIKKLIVRISKNQTLLNAQKEVVIDETIYEESVLGEVE
jgi:hypothetical protein